MTKVVENIPGVNVNIEALIRIRSRLAGLSFKQFRQRSTQRSGLREIRARGRGMEYEESRAYVPGDDVRTMDWRVMARTGEAHTKVFTEEKERCVMLVMDLSSSMFFGTKLALKSHAAAEVAAHLGWLAIQAGDRLGGLVASTTAHHEIRPKKSSAGLMQIFHYLAQECNAALPVAHGRGRLNFMLSELHRVIKPGTIVVLISDLLGIDPETTPLLASITRNNDLMVFWMHDRAEVQRWPAGRYEILLEDDQVSLDLRDITTNRWLTHKQSHHQSAIEQLINHFKLGMCPVSCNRPVTPQLLHYLRG